MLREVSRIDIIVKIYAKTLNTDKLYVHLCPNWKVKLYRPYFPCTFLVLRDPLESNYSL